MLSGYLPHHLTTLHATYGDVVRISPDMLSFISGSAWTDIYGHGASRRFEKWGMTRSHKGSDHILSANNEDHARQRRLINHAFSDKALRAQEDIVMRYIDQLLHALRSRSGETVNVKEWLEWTAFDIVGDLAFGEPFGCLTDGAYHPWVSLLFPFIKALSLFGAARLYKPFTPLLIALLPKKDIRQRAQHIRLSAEKVHKRLAAGEQPHRSDFWTYILRHNDEKGMSREEMEANAGIFITGGSETVATALCGIMYLLAKNPEAMRQLREEVLMAFTKAGDINMISVGGLKVLHATINEGMRIYPPVPAGLQRTVPQGGAVVGGHFVPGGVSLSHITPFSLCVLETSSANANVPHRQSSTSPNNPPTTSPPTSPTPSSSPPLAGSLTRQPLLSTTRKKRSNLLARARATASARIWPWLR